MTETFEIVLTKMTYGGDCMGRLPDSAPHAGQAVFVPFALPGEKVRVRLVEEKRGHARAELVEILSPGPERIIPRCPHYPPLSPHLRPTDIEELPGQVRRKWGDVRGACGGCHYQHLSYPAQLATKTAILGEQLERLGGLSNPPVHAIIPSPNPWNYRNYVQFHLTPQGKLGFEAAHSNQVIPIRECHLPEKPLTDLWPQLDIAPIPNLERVSLRLGTDDEMMIIFECTEPLDFTIEDLPISAVQVGPGGTLVLAGSDHLVMEVGNRPFRVSPGSFFQVNTPLAAAMVDHLLTNLPFQTSTTLLDLYCGVGLFSAFLAPKVRRLVGVEISPSACEDFTANLDEFDHVELYEADVSDVLPALDFRPEVILVDPPRAGLGSHVLGGIIQLAAPTLAYISCDPATLARDARHLVEGGYHLKHITPFDLFPQTYHIESISIWEK